MADVPGAARLTFGHPAAPPQARGSLLARTDIALDDPGAVEEFAFELAAFVATTTIDARFFNVSSQA